MVAGKTVLMFVLGLGMAGALSAPAMAQQDGGGRAGGFGGQRFDPEAMKARRLQQLKESLGVTDEEWKALEPKIKQVQDAQAAIRAGLMFGGRQRGAGGPAPAPAAENGQQSPVAVASRELRQTLDNQESTPEQIKAKLEALREAKEKANKELTAAQAELKELLTARQEAVLVSQGVLN